MPVAAQPYINFSGACEEALNFYKQAVGAEVTMMMRYGEAPPNSGVTPGREKKVLHAAFTIGQTTLFGSDGYADEKPNLHGIAISLTVKDVAEAESAFKALSAGGSVQAPLSSTFFAKSFGMLQDKFGLGWMILCPAEM